MKDQDHLKVAKTAGEFFEAMKKQELEQTYSNKRKTRHKNNNPFITPAAILATGLIIAAFLYAYAHRYSINKNYIEDKWTSTYHKMEERN
nr:hypothetical protein [uncultured Draconibacterium sp.]